MGSNLAMREGLRNSLCGLSPHCSVIFTHPLLSVVREVLKSVLDVRAESHLKMEAKTIVRAIEAQALIKTRLYPLDSLL